MNNRDTEAFIKIDRIADRSRKHLFSLSPNDALVQISLPLVLILAIATRLMILSQSMTINDKGPAILDLWKQQLILRTDKILENWERKSEYNAFPEFSRVLWKANWPADKRFITLCTEAQALNNIGTLSSNLYYKALSYQPTIDNQSSNDTTAYLFDIYDPEAPNAPPNAEKIPLKFRITPERRKYAIEYINKRCLSWKQHIEDLQWSLVAACAERSPISETWSDSELAVQMQKLSSVLKEKDYPLLLNLTEEYRRTGDNTK